MWRYVAALLLNPSAFAWIPGIEEHLQPPRHEALEHFEFLAVLRVDKDQGARRGVRHAEQQRTQGHPWPWSWGRTLLKPFAALHKKILSPLSSTAIVDWSWPQDAAMESQFEDSEQLASGSFGVVFLAKDKKTNQQVAVKLLKGKMTIFGEGIWATSKIYHEDKDLQALVDESRQECINIQKIQEGQSKDPDGAARVLKCLYDGITPSLQDPASEHPLYIVLEYAGRNDLDKWWLKFVNQTKLHKDYVVTFNRMAKDMFMGLKFLAESPTDTQWVHHDLKALNMVVKDEGQLMIVDLGTALSTAEPSGQAACTAFARPPEVALLNWLIPRVGFKAPVWSFDVFSAANVLLGMAGDTIVNGKVTGVPTLPYYTYYMQEIVQHAMVKVQFLARAIHCAQKEASDPQSKSSKAAAFSNAFYACIGDISSEEFTKLNTERLEAIQGMHGEERKAALAGLVNCRQFPIRGQVVMRTLQLGTPNPSPFFWTLLDQWIATGFDGVLLRALSSDPTQRPRPSEILEAQWFKDQDLNVRSMNSKGDIHEGSAVEFSCPEYPMNDGAKLVFLGILMLLVEVASCCFCCAGGIFTSRRGTWVWKWMLPVAGALSIMAPIAEFYIVSFKYLWLLLMVPVGLTMIILGASVTPQLQAKLRLDRRWYMGVVAVALLLVVLLCLDHTLTLSSVPYTAQQIRQAIKDGVRQPVPTASEDLKTIDKILCNFLVFDLFCLAAVGIALGSLVMDSTFASPMQRTSETPEMQPRQDLEMQSRVCVAPATAS